jgi:hypothetical protein
MTERIKRKITFVTSSCANCYFGRFSKEICVLWCDKINKEVKPSKTIIGSAIYYHDIPDDCPFPVTDEPDQFDQIGDK